MLSIDPHHEKFLCPVCDEHFRNRLKYSFLTPKGMGTGTSTDTLPFSCVNVAIQKMKRVTVKNLPTRRIDSLATSTYLSFWELGSMSFFSSAPAKGGDNHGDYEDEGIMHEANYRSFIYRRKSN